MEQPHHDGSLSIIPLAPGDASEALKMARTALENALSKSESADLDISVKKVARRLARRAYYGWQIRVHDRLAGFVIASNGTAYIILEALYVARDHQRQGYGTMLLERAFQFGRERNVPYIQLSSDPESYAFAWYIRRGFTRLDPAQAANWHRFLRLSLKA